MKPRYSISFTQARWLSFALTLLVIGGISLMYSLVISRAAENLRVERDVQQRKEHALVHVPLLFVQVGSKVYNHDPRQPIAEAELIDPLDEVRESLRDLRVMSLTDLERAGANSLAQEERRLRTAAYSYARTAGTDPSGDLRSQTLRQINAIVASAVDTARGLYEPLEKEMSGADERLVAHLDKALDVLVLVTVGAFVVKVVLSMLLGRALAVPISAMLQATQAIGQGQLGYRINSPYKDSVGQLASGIDEMAARLEVSEREVQKALADLSHQAEELRQARDAAQGANRAKSEFLANMSHEIRTPMTAILGFAELLGDPSAPADQRANHADTIRRNGKHLLSIISDVLDLSKVEAGRMQIENEPVVVRHLVDEIVQMLTVRAREKRLTLSAAFDGAIPDAISSDAKRLRQILMNLVGNALKFTEHGGVKIVVSTAPDATGSRILRFDVIDTGIGLSSEEIGLLFRPFTQIDNSATRRFGGTGLGLSISKRLAEMLGGDIRVSSEVGKGSVFTLTTSAVPAEAKPARPEPAADAPGAELPSLDNSRILVAEDGVDNQRLIGHFLNKAGAAVTFAETGRIACDMVHKAVADKQPFDVILMDMQMPDMDGYAATAALRATGCTTPILALTAHAMEGDRQKCLASGCNDYIAKPIDRGILLRTVDRHLTLSRRNQAA